MLFNIVLSEYQRARIWIDELPPAEYAADDFLDSDLPAQVSGTVPRISVGVEIYVSLGPRILYGLVGLEVKNDAAASKVSVGISSSESKIYKDPIAEVLTKMDRVFIGLPPGYANAVHRGFIESIGTLGGYPTANIKINHAAYAEISSSEAFFYKISKILPTLLFLKDEEILADKLEGIVKRSLV